jgi:hypothetical protein
MMHVVLPADWWLASDGNHYPPDAVPGRPPLEWVEPRRVLWGTVASVVVLAIAGLLS